MEYWTGLIKVEGHWYWQDGAPLAYENWIKQQSPNREYIYMKANYRQKSWIAVKNEATPGTGFICKYTSTNYTYSLLKL